MGFQEGLLIAKGRKALSCKLLLSRLLVLLVQVLGMEKSLSLELGASSLSGLLAFGRSGPLALLPAWMGRLVGPKDARPTGGLRPRRGREPTPRDRVLHWDMCLPGLQPLGCHDPGQHGTRLLDCYMEPESSTLQILKERAAAGGWRL